MALSLDPELGDDELRAQAQAMNLIEEGDLTGRLAELRRDATGFGLRTMVYSGKLKAGCKVSEKVGLAMGAGIGTSAFCRAKVMKDDPNRPRGTPPEYIEEVCPHWDGCPAIAQRAEIAQSHMVFMPHSFLALAIPEELEEVRAVIADERIHHLFLHTAVFSAASLGIARMQPRLTKKEKAEGVSAEGLQADRDFAGSIAQAAFVAGECPAAALFAWRPDGAEGTADAPGFALVKAALRVCGSAIQRDQLLSPKTPIEEVRALCARPTGRDLREELQFWKIVDERMEGLRKDDMLRETQARLERELVAFSGTWEPEMRMRMERSLETMRSMPREAKGAFDHRIQHLTEACTNGGVTESVRISWREAPNWKGVPVLLLDASASPPIVAKIWGIKERDVVLHDIVEDTGRALNVKIVGVVSHTFSNSSVAASAVATDYERLQAAKLLGKIRMAISTVASVFGHGRVVAGTSIVLREITNRDWACPDNVDWGHYGALRGLDGFKHHAAAISIGRMEPPARTVDGLVAALTYDDDEPEAPFDRNGDGMDPDDPGEALRLPLGEQRVRLRSGHVAVLQVPMFRGRWARLVQKQYREEELLQFVGRLRPVYREGRPPVWFALSSVIPEELIVDDLVHIDDLLDGRVALWDAVRRTRGVAEPRVLAAECPDAFRAGPASARNAMLSMGFHPEGLAPSKRAAEGFASWRWTAADGSSGGIAFVRAEARDAPDRLRAAMLSAAGIEVGPVEAVWSPDVGKGRMAHPREPDAVEERIGPAEGRPAREREFMDRVGVKLLGIPGRIDDPIEGAETMYPFMEEAEGSQVPARVVGAFMSLTGFWRARAGIADDRLMPLLIDGIPESAGEGDEDAPYDHLGGTVTDGGIEMAA